MPYMSGIYYTIHNAGPDRLLPLVLIHGAGGNHLSWPANLRRLPGRQVVGLDLPGHGKSEGEGRSSVPAYAAVINSWMEGIGIRQAILAGHSMGGAIALWMALEYPQRVGGSVLVGTGARMRVHPDLLARSGNAATFALAVAQVTDWVYSEEAPPNLVRLAGQRLGEVSPLVLQADFMACDEFDVRDRLEQVTQPSLVICGEADQMVPLKYATFLANGLPAARLVVIQGAGHMVMLEKPEEVAGAVSDFLSGLTEEQV